MSIHEIFLYSFVGSLYVIFMIIEAWEYYKKTKSEEKYWNHIEDEKLLKRNIFQQLVNLNKHQSDRLIVSAAKLDELREIRLLRKKKIKPLVPFSGIETRSDGRIEFQTVQKQLEEFGRGQQKKT